MPDSICTHAKVVQTCDDKIASYVQGCDKVVYNERGSDNIVYNACGGDKVVTRSKAMTRLQHTHNLNVKSHNKY